MARRGRSIDRSYLHGSLLKPLVPCYWQQDTLTAETREAAGLPETPVKIILKTPEPEPAQPLVKPAPTKKPRTKRAKPIPPTRFKCQFSPDGEFIEFIDVEANTESENKCP
ncbi:MAG TPA: hypothetical protein VK578_09190 [Edaphobacter sp.]|nr:hypothetical protein [Edaphobacter sp.]